MKKISPYLVPILILFFLFFHSSQKLTTSDRTMRGTEQELSERIITGQSEKAVNAGKIVSATIWPTESKNPIKFTIPFKSVQRLSFSSKIRMAVGTDRFQVNKTLVENEIEIIPLDEGATGAVTVATEDNNYYVLEISTSNYN